MRGRLSFRREDSRPDPFRAPQVFGRDSGSSRQGARRDGFHGKGGTSRGSACQCSYVVEGREGCPGRDDGHRPQPEVPEIQGKRLRLLVQEERPGASGGIFPAGSFLPWVLDRVPASGGGAGLRQGDERRRDRGPATGREVLRCRHGLQRSLGRRRKARQAQRLRLQGGCRKGTSHSGGLVHLHIHDAGRVSRHPRSGQFRGPRLHHVGGEVSLRACRFRAGQAGVQEGLPGEDSLPYSLPHGETRLEPVHQGSGPDDSGGVAYRA